MTRHSYLSGLTRISKSINASVTKVFCLRATRVLKLFTKVSLSESLQFLTYPIVLLVVMPRVWFQSLWRSRNLLQGRWDLYMGFDPLSSLNNLFYRTQWENLRRFGTNGHSPFVGTGDYPLARWFHLSLISSYLYSNAGAVTMLAGSIVTFLSLIFFIEVQVWWWVLLAVCLTLVSPTAFAMAFYRQNYQILGWMWIPGALYALHSGQWVLATLLLLTSASFAVTPFLLMLVPVSVGLVGSPSIELCVCLLITVIFASIVLIRPWKRAEPRQGWRLFGVQIGTFGRRTARYRRTSMKLHLPLQFVLVTYGLVTVLLWMANSSIPWSLVLALILTVVNERLCRVADFQSLVMLLSVVLVTLVLLYPPSFVTMFALWFALATPPTMLGVKVDGSLLSLRVRPVQPFSHDVILNRFRRVFARMPPVGTTLMIFRDPAGIYENVFDGFRRLIETPILVGMEFDRRVFPDWYFIAETNQEGAPDVWCQTWDQVKSKVKEYNADSVIVFSAEGRIVLEGSQETFLTDFQPVDLIEVDKVIDPMNKLHEKTGVVMSVWEKR